MATSTVFESAVTETIRVSLALGDGISLPPGATTTAAVGVVYLLEDISVIVCGTGALLEMVGASKSELTAVTSLVRADYGSLQETAGATNSKLAAASTITRTDCGFVQETGGATSDLAAISAQVSATITEMGTAYDTAGTLPINEQKIFDEEEVPTHPLLAAQTLFAKATDSAALGIALFLPAETWAC